MSLSRPIRTDEPLTDEDVEQLPEGALVEVIWSGGNGPHRYRIHVEPDEQRYAIRPDGSTPPGMLTYNPLDFVGQERYHTRVWLVDEDELAVN